MKTSFLLAAILTCSIATSQPPKTKAEAVKILQQYINLGNEPDERLSMSTLEYIAEREVLIYETKKQNVKVFDKTEIPLKSIIIGSIRKSSTMVNEHSTMYFECKSAEKCITGAVLIPKGKGKVKVDYTYSNDLGVLTIPNSVDNSNPGGMPKILEAFTFLVKIAQE